MQLKGIELMSGEGRRCSTGLRSTFTPEDALDEICLVELGSVPRFYMSSRTFRLVVSEGADETRERLDAIFATDEVTPSGLTTTALLVGWRAKPRAAYSSTDEDPFGIPSSRPCPSIFLRGTAASEPMPPEIPELRRCLIYGSISAPPGHDNAYHDGGLPTLYLYATELTDPRYFAGLFAMEQDLSSFASPRSRPPAASVDADLDVWLGDLLGSDDDGSSDHSPLPPWHASEDLQRKFESMVFDDVKAERSRNARPAGTRRSSDALQRASAKKSRALRVLARSKRKRDGAEVCNEERGKAT